MRSRPGSPRTPARGGRSWGGSCCARRAPGAASGRGCEAGSGRSWARSGKGLRRRFEFYWASPLARACGGAHLPTLWGGRGGQGKLVGLGRVRKERDSPRALERCGQRALVAGACARHAPGQDLAAVAHESAQPRDFLVVDVRDLLHAEGADLAMLALRTPASTAGAASARLEKLHVVGDDLGHASLLPILSLPRTGLDAALHVNQSALARVLGYRLGQVPLADRVGDDVVVVGELLFLAVRPGRPPVGRDAEVGDRGAAGRISHLRVLRQPADEQRLVQI